MRTIIPVVIFFVATLFTSLAFADDAAKDPVTFPSSGTIGCLEVADSIFGITNCYLLIGPNREAMLIDCADALARVSDKKLLVDTETRHATLVNAADVAQYQTVGKDTVCDPKTKRTMFVYDQFRSTNTYGPRIVKILDEQKISLKYIILTHGHQDHFGALAYLKEKTGATVIMHDGDLRAKDGANVVRTENTPLVGYPKDAYRIVGCDVQIDRVLAEGDLISLDGMVLQVIHTPGHSPGSISLRTKKDGQTVLFSGDTLFHWGYRVNDVGEIVRDEKGNPQTDDIGRTNFIDGSGNEPLLYRSIRRKLFLLPDDTVVLPAHGETTTIGEEKKYSMARFVPLEDEQPAAK